MKLVAKMMMQFGISERKFCSLMHFTGSDSNRKQFNIRTRRTEYVARMKIKRLIRTIKSRIVFLLSMKLVQKQQPLTDAKDDVDHQQSKHDRCALNSHANTTTLRFLYGANTGDRRNYAVQCL
eukprot:jgi/Psemu1/48288/gm1.48288_g